MIKGIGTDLIEVERIEKAMTRPGFLDRYFTDKELELFQAHNMSPSKVAGNFCVKVAVVKAFGTGFKEVRLGDIEVLRDQRGKPYVNLYRKAVELTGELLIDYIHVSISNTKEYVTAVAVAEKV